MRERAPKRLIPQTPGAPLGAGMVITRSELGNALRMYRLRVGLSQRQVARALECSQGRLGMLERGENRNLTDGDLRCLALLFKIRESRLRRLIPPPVPVLPPLTPLARVLRARREALGLSRIELAARIGTSAMHIGTLERTARGIRYSMMIRLCDGLCLDHSVLAPFVSALAAKPGSALGLAIRQRRKELCFSAETLGRLAGISKTLVLAVEAGRVNLGRDRRSDRTIAGLARALQMDAAELSALRRPPGIPKSTPPAKTVGGHLARQRIMRRWSQHELSRRAGVAPAAICWIELDKRCPRVSTLQRLATALEIDLGPLLRMTAKRRRDRYRRKPAGAAVHEITRPRGSAFTR